MKFRLTALAFFIFSLCTAQTRVTVLSYNIYHGELAYEPGKPNLDSVAALINQYKPDFVALQEVDSATGRSASIYGERTDYVKELAARTGMLGYFGKAMDYDSGGYGEALLSRRPLTTEVAILPTPAGGEPRALIFANTRLANGQNIIIGGTHLCHQFEDNRLAQVKYIDSTYRSLLVPSLLCGDFNFESSSAAYEILSKYWKDAGAVARKVPPPTYSTKDPAKRIDYVFYTKRGNWRIVRAETFPVSYSDHLPILFTFELTLNE